jgi:hypothetical protein
MVRRGVFALVLIGAAFGGGAVINGPGLAWIQRNFALGRSIIVDEKSSHEPASTTKIRQFPTASTSPMLFVPTSPEAAPAKKASKPVAELAQADPPLLPESPSTPASALAPLPQPAPPEPATLPPLDRVTRLASLERPEPASASTSPDWASLRKKMKALGVVRYTLEGEADGHVRFSCVIPVEGLKAVGHHFEAEADDEYHAAEAALKRVALWKATTQD